MSKGAIVTRAEDFPRWYQEVVARAEMAENGPVRGTMVIRPWGYGIWELLQAELDRRIKEAGAENAYFPLFIPESFLQPRSRARRGVQPRAGRGHPRRGQGARGAGGGPSDQRDRDQQLLRQVDPEPPRPAAAHQPVGQRGALGAAAPALPPDDRVPLAGGSHRPRHRGRCPRLCPADPARRLPGHHGGCGRVARADRPQDGAGALRRRHAYLDVRGDDG